MFLMLLKIVKADGTPASDAVVMIANAPVAVPDIGMVADPMGIVEFVPPSKGAYEFSIFYEGSEWKELLEVVEDKKEHTVILY